MSFSNRIRLPFKLHKPQFPEQAERYRKANGETVTLSVVVRKVYEGLTDSIPEKLHERLKIALVHDHVEVEGDKYVGVISQDGDYQIEWQDFLSHPLAQGKFKAEVTPFNATNSNCGTCQEMVQVVAVDDNAGTLAEDTTYVIDVLANDDICCNPVTLSLLTFNSSYLDSATITVDNKIQIHTKAVLPDLTNAQIISYRAQCANGQYDEANVFADLDGTVPACNPPTDLAVINITDNTATVTFTPAAGAVGYTWELREHYDLSIVVQSGSVGAVDHVDLTLLQPVIFYRFFIRTDCGSGNYSPFVYIDFATVAAPPSNSCGQYELFNTDDQNYHQGSYTDCDDVFRGLNISPLHTRTICVLQSSPGVPVNLSVESEISVSYLGLC